MFYGRTDCDNSACSEVNTGVLPVLLLWGDFSNSPRGSSEHLNFIFYPENLIWPVLNSREKGKSFVWVCATGTPCFSISFCKVLGRSERARCKMQCTVEDWCFNSSGVTEQILLSIPGIVKEDPKVPEDKILPPPSPRPQNSIFDTDEEKSKVNLRVFMPIPPLICTDEETGSVIFGGFWSFRQSIFRIMLILLAVQQLENSLMLCQKFLPSIK